MMTVNIGRGNDEHDDCFVAAESDVWNNVTLKGKIGNWATW